jgi:hypothetical protein
MNHYLDDTVNVRMPERAACFTAIALRNRIHEIEKYHLDHPDLPCQADVLDVYRTALGCVNAVLPEYAKEAY